VQPEHPEERRNCKTRSWQEVICYDHHPSSSTLGAVDATLSAGEGARYDLLYRGLGVAGTSCL
jgi:hypothetical protein